MLYKNIKMLDVDGIQSLLKDSPENINTYRKGYLLKSILKKINSLKTCGEILSEGIEGDESLRGIRNKYAHTVAKKLDVTDFDKKCVHIRQEARRQLKNIDDIREKL